jgi:hypothetical protein
MSVRALLAALCVVLALAAPALAWHKGGASGGGAIGAWHILPIGGGGDVSGIDINQSDGTMVIRTDSAGAYIWNSSASKWGYLFSGTSMAGTAFLSSNYGWPGFGSSQEVRICPANSSIMYGFDGNGTNAYLFYTSNKGAAWTQLTAFGAVTDTSNSGASRNYNGQIAIDPNNCNIAYVSSSNGIQYTTDGGSSWTTVSTSAIPAPTSSPYNYNITFDPTSGTSGGATQGIYVSSYGNGYYHTTNGGSSWTSIGGPTAACNSSINGSTGALAVVNSCGSNNNCVYEYSSGSWNDTWLCAGGGANNLYVALWNPNNWSEIAVLGAGYVNVSYNGGSTWCCSSSWAAPSMGTFTAAWLQDLMASGGLGAIAAAWPPGTNQIVVTGGAGVFLTTIPASGSGYTTATWTDDVVGLENLSGGFSVDVPPGTSAGSQVITSEYDIPDFLLTPHLSTTPTYPGATNCVGGTSTFCTSPLYGVEEYTSRPDWAAGNASFVVGAPSANPGTTTNFQGPMTAMSGTKPSGYSFGSIAAADTADYLLASNNSVTPVYTNNSGASFTSITSSLCSGLAWNSTSDFAADSRQVAADRVNVGTYYLLSLNNGLFNLTNYGASCTEVYSGGIDGSTGGVTLKTVPGEAGHLFYTGYAFGTTPTALYRSTNGGSTWSTVSTVTWASKFGFGATESGGTYPTVIIYGKIPAAYDTAGVGGVGVWKSINNCSTWTSLGQYPNNSLSVVEDISGDPTNPGWYYVATNGQGFLYYH